MNVKALIKELGKMPQDAIICVADSYACPAVTESAGISLVNWHPDDSVHSPHWPEDGVPDDARLAVLFWPADPEDYEPPTVYGEVI